MKTYEFSYGKGTQTVDLPEEHIIYDLHGKEVAVEKDIASAALKAMRDPIDSKPLAEIVHKHFVKELPNSHDRGLFKSKFYVINHRSNVYDAS